jgi:hypothetical protein
MLPIVWEVGSLFKKMRVIAIAKGDARMVAEGELYYFLTLQCITVDARLLAAETIPRS